GAVEAVSEIAEGSLDYVIETAGLIALWSQWDAVDVLEAGTSVLAAKFAARYAKEGVLFMSICSGSVDSGFEGELTEEQKEKVTKLRSQIVNYAPHFTGPSTPVDSAKAVLKVINEASLEKGSSGAPVSKFGNKQWM
ncbi:hypothetical protein FocTR4_00000031, partial [Fusarium oxysporum f. sp. cubense]